MLNCICCFNKVTCIELQEKCSEERWTLIEQKLTRRTHGQSLKVAHGKIRWFDFYCF